MGNRFCILLPPKQTSGRNPMERLQKVRLPLTIRSRQYVEAWTQQKVEIIVISKLMQLNALNGSKG